MILPLYLLKMKVSSAVSCCPCSWPYFLTLSYISGRNNNNMEESLKPASLSLSSVGQALLPSQTPPVSISTPSDTGESLKSPNMSTDSGFEGENNRPLLLPTTMSSPSKDVILSSWHDDIYERDSKTLQFSRAELTSPKSPKKSTDDSDFNESPFDKKSVPSVGDIHSESDNECSPEHCTFFTADASWSCSDAHLGDHMGSGKDEDILENEISAFGICLSRNDSDSEDLCVSHNNKNQVEIGECLACHKVHIIDCIETQCSSHLKWSGTLSSINENKDCLIYAEGDIETNSEEDYDQNCKQDTETDTSDEKVFDGAYSDDALSAYYVPSAVSVTTEDYQRPMKLLAANAVVKLPEEKCHSKESIDDSCCMHGTMCKSLHCPGEPSCYTTVLKPKAVRPTANSSRADYHSSLESLHCQRVVPFIGQHDRVSAFHERPGSSLSQNEGIHHFFSRSLDVPTTAPSHHCTVSQLSVVTASEFPSPNSCLFSGSRSHVSSLTDITSTVHSGHNYSVTSRTVEDNSDSREKNVNSCHKAERKLSQHSDSPSGSSSPQAKGKRFSMPWDLFCKNDASQRTMNYDPNSEPIHMTLEEVHSSLQTLSPQEVGQDHSGQTLKDGETFDSKQSSLGFLGSYLRQKKCKREEKPGSQSRALHSHKYQRKSFPVFIRSAFSNLFGLKKNVTIDSGFVSSKSEDELSSHASNSKTSPNTSPFTNRALPPLPVNGMVEWEVTEEEDQWTLEGSQTHLSERDFQPEEFARRKMDYAASIERVKDCGWYWGPISGETAEKLLSGEPDGSFVVRDSSDEHYIFSLTFKLNGLVRHVRIEHDHGNFSFGCLQKFRSNTIVDFIDSAVAHSRSGRYLFFLHRRPVLGPMRVQLLHPVSRFKHVQSLQHMCRFIILKTVRRDLIDHLPLPRRLKDYLNTPHYYSEELATLSLENKKCPESTSTGERSSQHEETPTESGSPDHHLSNG